MPGQRILKWLVITLCATTLLGCAATPVAVQCPGAAAGAEAHAGAGQESVAACAPEFIRDAAEDAARVEEARDFFRRHQFPTH